MPSHKPPQSGQKVVKIMKHSSGVAGWKFTKLEENVVILSHHDKFVLELRKVAPFVFRGR